MKIILRLKCFIIGHDESVFKSLISYQDYDEEITFCHRCGGVASKKIILTDRWKEMWARSFDHQELL